MKKIRAFIAVPLPGLVVYAIRQEQEKLIRHHLNIRWVNPENIHLTLSFLGDIEPTRIDDIAAVVRRTAELWTPFSLTAKSVGVFPNIKRARVIWVGVSGQVTELVEMQQDMTRRLSAIGFPAERRRFSGHLTLGRTKGDIDAGRLMKALDDIRSFESDRFRIDRITIYRSKLQSSGAVYTALQTVSLGPGNAQPE